MKPQDESDRNERQSYLTFLHSSPHLDAPRAILRACRSVEESDALTATAPTLALIKADAVTAGDELLAKAAWCFERIAQVQANYLDAFKLLKRGSYYDAWCRLERCEVELHHLDAQFHDAADEYGLEFIRRHVRQFQALFPYAVFLSPEILKTKVVCTICDQPVSLRHPCGHRAGEIYGGEMAARRITDLQLLGVAMVRDPFQKYSVPFMTDPDTGGQRDHYNYSLVAFVADRLRSAWDGWSYNWTTREQPHERWKHLSRSSPCPCESGRKYKACCLKSAGVTRPHCEITFDEAAAPGLSMYEYHD